MSLRIPHQFGLALLVSVTGLCGLRSEEPAREDAKPIGSSAPQSDAGSSNQNQIGAKASSLTSLESGLKKPFQIFELDRSASGGGPTAKDLRNVPTAPVSKNNNFKDLLDKEAEDKYLRLEDGELTSARDDLRKRDAGSLDASEKRGKTSMDRYYDGIETLRASQTNRPASSLDLFGEKIDPGEKHDTKPRAPAGLFDREFSGSARSMTVRSNNLSDPWRPHAEKLNSQSAGDLFGLGSVETIKAADRAQDTRLDDFKRLLDGPGYSARSEFNVAPPQSGGRAAQPIRSIPVGPSSILSATSPSDAGPYANSPGFSGTIGLPAGVPDFAANSPSLTPTPQLQPAAPKPPVPSFKIPRRRF